MIRFITFLLGRPYETCKSCETLKQQLAIANEEKRLMTETLLNILKPKVYEQSPVELSGSAPKALTFSRRRAAFEARDRETARLQKDNKLLGKPDALVDKKINEVMGNQDIEQLEEELGIGEEESKEGMAE